ncbi:putative transposase DNA-binding domain protein, partial [Bifidobacterium gallicum DSM 20093 = LMG 11596]
SDMTKKAKKKEDPNNPKRYLPNGQAAKRGLNRSMRAASLGGISQKLEYKTQLSMTNRLVLINPAYTSQTCSECHYCAKENRKSQADFQCEQCGMSMNADVNAAINILQRGYEHLLGVDDAQRVITEQDTRPANRGKSASARTRKTPT